MKKYAVLGFAPLVLAAMILVPSWGRRAQKADSQTRQAAGAGASATLMPDGRLLILGGEGPEGPIAAAYMQDVSTGTETPLSQGLLQPRAWQTATLLPNGTVLVFGGIGSNSRVVTSAEIFNPVSNTFTAVSTPGLTPRAHHTSTLLTDGHILIAGGIDDDGQTLNFAELADSKSLAGTGASAVLLIARHDQTATLLPDGDVLLWGGTDSHGAPINFGELFDPAALRFSIETQQYQVSTNSPIVMASIPADGSENVPVDAFIALRFSKPLLVTTVNSGTVTLSGPEGNVAATVVPGEAGMLAFVTPQNPLLPGTNYGLTLSGLTDVNGSALPQTVISFTTAGTPPEDTTIPLGSGGGDSSGGNGIDPQWQKLPPLQAPRGVTALAGQSLQLNGFPVDGLTLTVEDQNITTTTDGTGRFLLKALSAGHHVLYVDGTTDKQGKIYGTYEIGVDIVSGQNVLPYTIWMTELDVAHETTIPSPTTGATVISNPALPGLQLHILPGTTVVNHAGKTVTQISITPIPLGQPPFPLPTVQVPIYFTIQPGAAWLEGPTGAWTGAQLYYPNTYNSPAGMRYDFWNYDPKVKGWYIYGGGTVSGDRTQIIPDAGVEIYQFTGAMVATPSFAPLTFPRGSSAGDPVDLSSGLFVYRKTDLTLADVMPLALTRTYRPADGRSRAFGIGTADNYDIFLIGDNVNYTYQELVLPDGQRIRYNRTSSGTSNTNAVYIHSSTGSMFYGSQITWNSSRSGWDLTFKDGTVYHFPDGFSAPSPQAGALLSITDRNSNTITLTRDTNHNLTGITSPDGRSITLTYDTSYRITQAQDSVGRTVSYTYDSASRLSTVTDANGGVTTYTYDANNNMLTITDPKGILYLTN